MLQRARHRLLRLRLILRLVEQVRAAVLPIVVEVVHASHTGHRCCWCGIGRQRVTAHGCMTLQHLLLLLLLLGDVVHVRGHAR